MGGNNRSGLSPFLDALHCGSNADFRQRRIGKLEMAWPKKNTRVVVVNGETYQWQIDVRKALYRWVVVGKEESSGQLLFLDPYDLSTTPGEICQAIMFALDSGWHPKTKGRPMRLWPVRLSLNPLRYDFYLLDDDAVPGTMPDSLGAKSRPVSLGTGE